MKISFNWLKDYIALNVKPEVLAEKLTMAGLEVENEERKYKFWGIFKNL